jgi:hypothetical protein
MQKVFEKVEYLLPDTSEDDDSDSVAGIYLRPHDLGRNGATYASRLGLPIEII